MRKKVSELEQGIGFWTQRIYSGRMKQRWTCSLYGPQRQVRIRLSGRVVHGFSNMLLGGTPCQGFLPAEYNRWLRGIANCIGCSWEIKISELCFDSVLISLFSTECFMGWLIFEVRSLTFKTMSLQSLLSLFLLYMSDIVHQINLFFHIVSGLISYFFLFYPHWSNHKD